MTNTIPDGVHLNLSADDYFEQDALGSSDLMRLALQKWGWWWASRYNPDFVEGDNTARTYGSALHAIVLEGVEAYEGRFAAAPEKPAGAIETIPDMKAALKKGGFSTNGTSGWTKPDWQMAMRQNLPLVKVWPNMMEDFRATLGDLTELSAIDDRMIRLMASIALDPERGDNEEIRKLFAGDGGFPPLVEVSVFETLPDGLRRRWRIDRMFPRFDLDLKSLGNWGGRPLAWAVGDIIAKRGYDIQRADYYEGRRASYRAISEGRVHGGTPDQRRWLARFPEEFQKWDWVWLFYQKPAPTGRAPILFPVWDDTYATNGEFGPLMTYGMRKAARALAFYRAQVAEHGLEKPWARVDETHYTDADMPNPIYLPPWIAEDEAGPETAYEGTAA